MSRFSLILSRIAGVLVLPTLLINGCDKPGRAAGASGGGAPAPVLVGDVERRDVPVQIRSIASVEAFTTVIIKARVAGQLQKVHVVPGQEVKAGDLLFEIDPRPFEAALNEVQARFDRDKALANNAEIDAKRVAALLNDKVATPEEADKARFTAEAAQATVRADQAMVDNARLQLEYTRIRSPLDGRAGSVLSDQGNVVKADETQLLSLNQVKPIYVTFSIPEQDLAELRKRTQESKLAVNVAIPPELKPSEQGQLSFIDNQVDNDTGTIKLKATFENEDRRLWPGQFVQAVLDLTVERDCTVIPSRAVQNNQEGQFVFVVKEDMTVAMQPIVVRRSVGDESILERGPAPGQRVVTEGHLRLVEGSKVAIKQTATSQPTTRSLTQASQP